MSALSIYKGKKVLLTGHTGFKGSWTALWLQELGADVTGYSLAPATHPAHIELLKLDMDSVVGDIRDREKLSAMFKRVQPDIVIHMAAQPLVRYSYSHPAETYETNVIGTLNVFEACRSVESVRAIVNITTDKCYENREWVWAYRENDPMGGYDPYSSSKGCAELLTASYQRSFFNPDQYGKSHQTLLASVRAGNVIGGGDWAVDRLIPDAVRAAAKGEVLSIRNPTAVRPWQHVLDPLHGYLLLGMNLLKGETSFAGGWNFAPETESSVSVAEVLNKLQSHWSDIRFEATASNELHEAHLLRLDSTKAKTLLKWKPVLALDEALKLTAEWYRDQAAGGRITSREQLSGFISRLNSH